MKYLYAPAQPTGNLGLETASMALDRRLENGDVGGDGGAYGLTV